MVGSKQHELQMNPMQLLYYQAPISSAMLIVFVFYFEPPYNTLSMDISVPDVGMIFLSCIVALFVNISIYWIIGKTSPLTYNMVGHIKFCLTTLGGFLIFKEPMTLLQIVGVLLTLIGVSYYAHVKVRKKTGIHNF